MANLAAIKNSFYKYLDKELTDAEARQFLEHLQSGRDSEIFMYLIEESLDSPVSDRLLNQPELLALLNQSFSRVNDTIEPKPGKKQFKLAPRILASTAAAIALMIVGAYFFSYKKDGKAAQENNVALQHIQPGRTGATLTLANGKKIRLSDAANGEIAREAGISVTKRADGQLIYQIREGNGDPNKLNTLTTAKGETYVVTLPDKSMVWMNAASSLTYSAGLNERGQRRVKLEGEAYFQVAKDKAHPFIVETRRQQIEVLGTHFNVNAYEDEENVTTTLLEGAVKVAHQSGFKILKPGNQSAVSENAILISEVETERSVAWKNNKFLFENDDIQYIMRMIDRWYNVDVVYTGEIPTEKFGGGISRFDNVSQVLRILESTGGARFKIEGRKIFVSK